MLNLAWGDEYISSRDENIHNYDIQNYNTENIKWGHRCDGNTDGACDSAFADGTSGTLYPQDLECQKVGGDYVNIIPVGGSKTSPQPIISCNYEAGTTGPDRGEAGDGSPKFKVSHCQRKICTYPNLRQPNGNGNLYDGYRYIGNRPGVINETGSESCTATDQMPALLQIVVLLRGNQRHVDQAVLIMQVLDGVEIQILLIMSLVMNMVEKVVI